MKVCNVFYSRCGCKWQPVNIITTRQTIDILKQDGLSVARCAPETSADKMLVITEVLRTCFDYYVIQRSSVKWRDYSPKCWKCHLTLRQTYSVILSMKTQYRERNWIYTATLVMEEHTLLIYLSYKQFETLHAVVTISLQRNGLSFKNLQRASQSNL